MFINDQIIELITARGSLTPAQIIAETGKPRSTVFKALTELVKEGRLVKHGQHPLIGYSINTEPVTVIPSTPETVHTNGLRLPVQSKTEQRSPVLNLIIVLGLVVLILTFFLVQYMLRYQASQIQIAQLRDDLSGQGEQLKGIDLKLEDLQKQLNLKNQELADLSLKKDQQGVLLQEQKDALFAERDRIKALIEALKRADLKMQKDKKELLVRLDTQASINAKLQEDQLRLDKRLNELEVSYKDAMALKLQETKAELLADTASSALK